MLFRKMKFHNMTWSSPTQWGLLPCKHAACMRSKSCLSSLCRSLFCTCLLDGVWGSSFFPLFPSQAVFSSLQGWTVAAGHCFRDSIGRVKLTAGDVFLECLSRVKCSGGRANALAPLGTCSNSQGLTPASSFLGVLTCQGHWGLLVLD